MVWQWHGLRCCVVADAHEEEEEPMTDADKRQRRVSLKPDGDDDDINVMPDVTNEAAQPLQHRSSHDVQPSPVCLLSFIETQISTKAIEIELSDLESKSMKNQ